MYVKIKDLTPFPFPKKGNENPPFPPLEKGGKGGFDRGFSSGAIILLHAESHVYGNRIGIVKEIKIESGRPKLEFRYTVKNIAGDTVDLWFGPEFNFAMLDGNSDACQYYMKGTPLEDTCQRSRGEVKDVSAIGIRNQLISLDIGLSFSENCTLWRYPVETISQSESGFEREYQSSVLIPHWRFHLEEGREWNVQIALALREMGVTH